MARGDFVAFIDDDAVPDEDWLVDAIAAFDSDEVAGVGGFVSITLGTNCNTATQSAIGWAMRITISRCQCRILLSGVSSISGAAGTNSIFRRSALLEIGGFDEQFDYFLDETDVNVRLIDAGYTLKQIPKAFVYHRYLPSHIRNEKRVNTNYAPMIKQNLLLR